MSMLNSLIETLGLKPHNDPSAPATSMELDGVISVLSASRRRAVIRYLCTQETETSVRALSEHLAALEDTDRKVVYIALYQQHIPTLEEHDLVVWNQPRGTLRATQRCERVYDIQRALERQVTGHQIPV